MMAREMKPETVRPLVCVECGRQDPGDEPGWTLRLDVDDESGRVLPRLRPESQESLRATVELAGARIALAVLASADLLGPNEGAGSS
jgi:hypothetical protein